MRALVSAIIATTIPFTAFADADYRDCKDLFFGAVSYEASPTKSDGFLWDADAHGFPDVELTIKPSGRNDLLPAVVGPKMQDAITGLWGPVRPPSGAAAVGSWLPVRIGDEVSIQLTDRDALSSDIIYRDRFEIPKSLADSGFEVFTESGNTLRHVTFYVSVSDGIRTCKGGGELSPPVYSLANVRAIAQPAREMLAPLLALNDCDINKGSAVCRASAFEALHDDINNDGLPDAIVRTREGTSPVQVLGIWLGDGAGELKQIFLGNCDAIMPSAHAEVVCERKGVATAIALVGSQKGQTREVDNTELEGAQQHKMSMSSAEARSNLKAYYTAQRAHFQEKDTYSRNMVQLGFTPERNNRYTYFGAPRGTVQLRNAATITYQPEVNIISGDTHKHPELRIPSSLGETKCPLTSGLTPDGEPAGLGVTGVAPHQFFIGYAAANLDGDDDWDCWSIASFVRQKNDIRIEAGVPFHEASDYDEAVAEKHRESIEERRKENASAER